MKDSRVVIPAYNEEPSIGEVIDRTKKACKEAEIIVVDDFVQTFKYRDAK